MDQYQELRFATLERKVNELDRKVTFLLKHLGVKYREEIPPYLAEMAALVRQGKRAEALDAFIRETGVGLVEAKSALAEVERLLAQ